MLSLAIFLVALQVSLGFHAAFRSQRRDVAFISRHIRGARTFLPLSALEGEGAVADGVEGDLTEDEALIQRVMDEVMSVSGVELDQLINPGKVVNLERTVVKLNTELETCTDDARIAEIYEEITKKEKTLFMEKRSVMRGWLKNLFVGQSVLAGAISLGMVYNAIPGQDLPLPLRVLGFWSWWLFIIPSLRARKPQYAEKEALNVAFLASPLVSIVMPTFTKDVAIIWWANLLTVAACYAWAFSNEEQAQAQAEGQEEKTVLPKFVTQALNALDYGSGKERGARK